MFRFQSNNFWECTKYSFLFTLNLRFFHFNFYIVLISTDVESTFQSHESNEHLS